jgi:TrmH family RNA methyltransferase
MKQITSLQHPLVKRLTKLRKDRFFRNQTESVVIIGFHLVEEVCIKIKAKCLLCTNEKLISSHVKTEEIFLTTTEIIKKISGVQTPEGILAEVSMPIQSSLEKCHYLVALDGISDPGNLGTLLRTALALGWEGAFILENSVDPYNDKALRAAKGANFRLPIHMGGWDALQQIIKKNHLKVLAADLEGDKLNAFALKDNILLILGNEAHGISKEALSICQKITIPMKGSMESLNVAVAGGILMYILGQNGENILHE